MRLGEFDDKKIEQVLEEYKKRRGINVDLDATTVINDILIEWLNMSTEPKKKVNSK